MAAETKQNIGLEIGHVLFIDIVGYSKLLIDEQRDYLHTLNEVVRRTDSFRAADAAGKLTRLPTGDGMALVFATTPDAPVSCAMEISNALRSHGEGLLARMTKDEARGRAAFEAARVQQEKIVQAQPDYGPPLCVLAMIDAALGPKDLALDEGRRAIALMPLEKDVNNGSRVLQYFAITAAWAGEKEPALQQLETGLRAPDASIALSYGSLKLLPFWDPLRGDPRFEKIVASLAPKQ